MTENRFIKIKQVLWVILFANIGVAVLKIVIGSLIKSSSMTADGFHSLTDGSSNIIGLIGIKLASKPVDEDHPYGHRKFETLAGLLISGMLAIAGFKVIYEAVLRISHPAELQVSLQSILVLLLTLAVNIFVCTYEYGQGKKLDSYILISDSMHTKSDIFVSIGVLVTIVSIKLGVPQIIDPLASIVVAGFILHAAYEIFLSSSDILVDKAAVDTEKVRDIVMAFPQVKDAHKIRSRGTNDDLHIDLHIMTEPDMSVEESHNLIHDIEEEINNQLKKNVQVIVHIEPFKEVADNNIVQGP